MDIGGRSLINTRSFAERIDEMFYLNMGVLRLNDSGRVTQKHMAASYLEEMGVGC